MNSQSSNRSRPTGSCSTPFRKAVAVFAGIGLTLAGTTMTAHQAVAEGSECKDIYVLAAPGTDQGIEHNPGKSDLNSVFGEEVATVVTSALQGLTGKTVAVDALDYPALGVDGLEAPAAKLAYNISTYKDSKDKGYSTAYTTMERWAANCSQTRFVLAGYSQGAHIAGDLAQSILHGNGPIGRDRLAAAVLLADPAYNSTSPNANEFRYDGPPTSGDDRDQRTVVSDPDHWQIHGSLGERSPFDASDPVISVCIYGDPICDATSIGWNGYNAGEAINKAWMHGLYTHVQYTNGQDLATWAGAQAAAKAAT